MSSKPFILGGLASLTAEFGESDGLHWPLSFSRLCLRHGPVHASVSRCHTILLSMAELR